MAHKGKKDAQDAEVKRREEIRGAVEPAIAVYEDAKKALKKATVERRAANKAANDPTPAVSATLASQQCSGKVMLFGKAIHVS